MIYLITGGCGFIGSNFILYLREKEKDAKIINLDCLTYAANESRLSHLKNDNNYIFIKGDISDKSIVNSIFDLYDIDCVVNFAAESNVDNSIENPEIFLKTNVMGTFNLLDCARNHWLIKPFEYKENCKHKRFIQISTDEVYGSLEDSGYFKEESPYLPNSPYSASKAAADMIVRSYYNTFGLNTIITNCSNNYGPGQHKEKLIPKIIHNALKNEKIPLYGDGKNVRDWLYVYDCCEAINLLSKKGRIGESYNIGGKNERTNIYVAQKVCELLDNLKPKKDGSSYKELITFVKDRPGHDKRYALNIEKIEREINWKPVVDFEKGLLETIKWYLNNEFQSI